MKRKPWILLGYGMAALSKPLFPLAQGALPVLGARFIDRIGKGIRGAPRDAMIADETPPEVRGAAFGLRQAMDTVGAFLAPLAAVGLMLMLANDIRAVFWVAAIPAFLSFLFAWAMLREPERHLATAAGAAWGGWRSLDRQVRRLIGVGFLFGLARFSESFLILKAIDAGLAAQWSPLVLALFSLSYLLLAYPAGALSDRTDPKSLLLAGIAVLVAADLWLAQAGEPLGGRSRRRPVGRPYGADPGHFRAHDRRRGAGDPARLELRRLLLRQRSLRAACQPRRRAAVGPRRPGGRHSRPQPASPRWLARWPG